MILELTERGRKTIAFAMLALLYFETVIPSYAIGAARRGYTPVYAENIPIKKAVVDKPVREEKEIAKRKRKYRDDLGGPTQPESQAFHSVNDDNMVDLFSGDFSYNIPLMDVGGYPLALGYNSGISMDQEASWVGLGWNINPGTITRNMRGLPDDFDGTDTIQKIASIKDSKTVGVSVGAGTEIFGLPQDLLKMSGGVSIGINHNSYKGWGLESSIDASLNAGSKTMGNLTSGLSLTNSSQEGITVGGSLSYQMNDAAATQNGSLPAASVSANLAYNTRSGLKALGLSAGIRQYEVTEDISKNNTGSTFSTSISFAHPSFTPAITLPYTNTYYSFSGKLGQVTKGLDPNVSVSGYLANQEIKDVDKRLSLPAYGYLNYQLANGNNSALLDYNLEKDMPYREKPAVPSIAIPAYTYDVFSVSGEGTGGMFRAYRGDIGYVYDHHMKTKDKSLGGSVDLAIGDIWHWGVNIYVNHGYTQNGPWTKLNNMAAAVAFRKSSGNFEAAYFRNPGEKAVNDKAYYDVIGGDDVVAVNLVQANNSSPDIFASNTLNLYRNKKLADTRILTPRNTIRTTRDKRTQVISYLTASEASEVGLSKYIENYKLNKYTLQNCGTIFPDELDADKHGLLGEYFIAKNFQRLLFSKIDSTVDMANKADFNKGRTDDQGTLNTGFSVRWTGRVKAPVTGAYQFITRSDDGVRLYLNDSLIINRWTVHPDSRPDTARINLVADQLCNLKLEYFQNKENVVMKLQWKYAGLPAHAIPNSYLYQLPSKDTFLVNSDSLSREKRVNSFRKSNHISEIDVLNADGRRYVYGIPVYNLQQKDVTFAADAGKGNRVEGLVKYNHTVDNSVNNPNGTDHYFSSELVPAYAHSFLLTGILSPEYVDLTGDGITSDDPGDAIKLNYTKIAGIYNPYKWRAPYNDSATYNEGLRTDTRDDKASYVYGEKELWYLHSIESKNMIATFKMSDRKDMPSMNEEGNKLTGSTPQRLDEINLYTKADFQKRGTNARPIKTVHFEYGYDLCKGVNRAMPDSGKLTLRRVWFTYNGNNKAKKNPYTFFYNKKNPAYNNKSYDRWGNFKDPLQNPGSTTANLIGNAEYPYTLQDSTLASDNAAAWTLDSINIPSGGRMKVTYESDDYAYVQNRRATQMFKIAGFSANQPTSLSGLSSNLYGSTDNMYVSVTVPTAVSSTGELIARYLEGIDTFFFRLNVKMPADKFGSGNEYVSCYATMEPGGYGYFNDGKTIWIKLQAINKSGETETSTSTFSPLAKAAIQFLRLNLPSKAYPGSDVGDDITPVDAVKILLSQADNVINAVQSFDNSARQRGWAKTIDTARSYARLNSPHLKKYGGGLRVKSVRIYDHWNAMTKQKESVYGQEYQYTKTLYIKGVPEAVSSGVASYEPNIGGEENPWRLPLQYKEQAAALAPIGLGYVEKPLGEAFYPSPSVGYSKVRVRSINVQNKRSANGYAETCFYTSYDFPTLTDMTLLADNKKRFKPSLSNLLRINARHFVAVSQGFKVELNDMNGKVKSQATYPETDPDKPVSYTENFYRVDNQTATIKHLNNTVTAINPQGIIDTAATIGKDIELMMAMREEQSVTNASNFNINADAFSFSIPPFFLIPTALSLAQREETLFRTAGTTKIINRHGILDSVIVIDKGSKVITRNLLYDSETGNVVLTSTQNEFNDPLYHFNWPAAWVYDGMSGAYSNINVVLDNVNIKQGKITSGLGTATAQTYFAAGDEILVASSQKTGGTDCNPEIATFPDLSSIYAVDANSLVGGTPDIYFTDRDGVPFTGNNISLKIIRSGRRNISAAAGEVVALKNPLVKTDSLRLVLDNTSKVLSAGVTEFKQFWKVADKKKAGTVNTCVPQTYTAYIADTAKCGLHYYGNKEISGLFTNDSCGAGYVAGDPVRYTVPADLYSSIISQEDADEKAEADLAVNGPINAYMYGVCKPYYYSAAIEKDYTKNDCDSGGTGSLVTYQQAEGTDSSLVSQAAADSLAMIRANANGQAYANANGTCTSMTVRFIIKQKPGASENTAHGYVTLSYASGGSAIASKIFDGPDIIGGAADETINVTSLSFIVTINSMTACSASVNGGSAMDVYSSARTVSVTGSTITVEIWYPESQQ